jgi:hypothetical protein
VLWPRSTIERFCTGDISTLSELEPFSLSERTDD